MRLFLLLFVARAVLAADLDPTFGPEWTFTNDALLAVNHSVGTSGTTDDFPTASPENMAAQEAMMRVIERVCRSRGECTIEERSDKYGEREYVVRYADGYKITLTLDCNVVEVLSSPLTESGYARQRSRIERDVFGAAKRVGLAPSWNAGAGHVHIGASIFENNPTLFLNFFIDYANHAELGTGILAYDPENAAPMALLPKKSYEALQDVVADFRAGRLTDVEAIAKRIWWDVYAKPTSPKRASRKVMEWNAKNVAMNVSRLMDPEIPKEQRTVEIRAVRAPMTFREFQLETKLFRARLNYLRGFSSLLPLEKPRVPRIDNRLRRFHQYVTESGLKWSEMRELVVYPGWEKNLQRLESCGWSLGEM